MNKSLPAFALCLALLLCVSAAAPAEQIDAANANSTLHRRCSGTISADNLQLFSTVAGGPYSTASDDACLTACPTSSGWLGGTRQKSTGNCWCIKQPFGSPASGVYNADFNSRFNPNTPNYACQSWTVGDQKWMFGSYGTSGPHPSANIEACVDKCNGLWRDAWTRQRSTGYCWCGTGNSWQSNALLYDTNFDAGIADFM